MNSTARPTLRADDPRHGTTNGYGNLKCRYDQCKTAWAVDMREKRQRRRDRLAADDPRHGRSNTYLNHGCRCDACREAHAGRPVGAA